MSREEIRLDESYQTYVNRVARLTLPASYASQLQNLQSSPKFKRQEDGTFQAASFPGYSVINPPYREDPLNEGFYQHLQETQQQLIQQLGEGLLIRVPPQSFHVTLADLIWDSGYREAVKENPNFDQQLENRIAESFQQCHAGVSQGKPASWQLLGLMLRPRAIAVCLVPKDEKDYERTIALRRCIYQNSSLIGLGIEQQYHFTAHVTLGYFGEIPENLDSEGLTNTLTEFNDRWLEAQPQVFQLHRAELRKFDDMTRYYRESHFPVMEF